MRLLPVLLVLSMLPGAVRAQDGRINFLSRQLQKSSDARVRAQAALMLGATRDVAALEPLCGGLQDTSEVVRTAAVKGLQQLDSPPARACLQRAAKDPSASVRGAVAAALGAGSTKKVPAEFYIQMLPVQDKSARLDRELLQLTEEQIRQELEKLGSVFAPAKESRTAARSVIKNRRLKGYSLKVELDQMPSGGLRMNVVCFTYPEQSLLGQVQVKASGARAADLIRALAPKAIDEAASTFDWRM